MAFPAVVSREAWLEQRKKLLAREKELTKLHDEIAAERRRMPVVKIAQKYQFEGVEGQKSLLELFENRRQLIVYHFMFDPGDPPPGEKGDPWEEGCRGCSHVVDNLPHLAHLYARDTSLVLVSRAPLSKILPFKKRMGWAFPWYSSFGTTFNYDFHVTADPSVASVEYNYRTAEELQALGQNVCGELPGISVFLRDDEAVYHSYSAYSRGLDILLTTNNLLDLTPYGRQETWEDSPPGWPQTPTHGWWRHHDRYETEATPGCCSRKG
jgi:predicted dithiol-disulfide oxidoreductase (DUF899 family)